MKYSSTLIGACALLMAVTYYGSQKAHSVDNATDIPVYIMLYKTNKGEFVDEAGNDKAFVVKPGEHVKLREPKLNSGEKQQFAFSAGLENLANKVILNKKEAHVFTGSPSRMTNYYKITGDANKLKLETKLLDKKTAGNQTAKSFTLMEEFKTQREEFDRRQKKKAEIETERKLKQQEKEAKSRLAGVRKDLEEEAKRLQELTERTEALGAASPEFSRPTPKKESMLEKAKRKLKPGAQSGQAEYIPIPSD